MLRIVALPAFLAFFSGAFDVLGTVAKDENRIVRGECECASKCGRDAGYRCYGCKRNLHWDHIRPCPTHSHYRCDECVYKSHEGSDFIAMSQVHAESSLDSGPISERGDCTWSASCDRKDPHVHCGHHDDETIGQYESRLHCPGCYRALRPWCVYIESREDGEYWLCKTYGKYYKKN